MEKENKVVQPEMDEEIVIPESLKPKKKIFTKKNLKRAGMIIGGAVVAGVVMLLGFAALGSAKSEDTSEDSDVEDDDNDLLKLETDVSEEENSEITEG